MTRYSGRRQSCTPEVTKTVTDNMKLGLSNRDSAALAGISEAAYYKWCQRGEAELARLAKDGRRNMRDKERPYVEFLQAVKKAIPARKQLLIGQIQKAARNEGQWQAAAWLLERLHNDEFGKRSRVDVVSWREVAERDGLPPEAVDAIFEADVDALAAKFFEEA